MSNLDADAIRQDLGEVIAARLGPLEVFAEIDSTNSYLLQQPAPAPGTIRVAATDNQTAGRGRYGRTWQSPAGTGLCLSVAYTFSSPPENLPALTLAIGLGAIEALQELDIKTVELKWPNDLIAMDNKLGGILTESRGQPDGTVTVVSGIGLNIDLDERLDDFLDMEEGRHAIDLKSQVPELPDRNRIAASLLRGISKAIVDFEDAGLAPFSRRWAGYDWLFGRQVTIDTPQGEIKGSGAGIAADGALLIDTLSEGRQRVTSGSVRIAGLRERGQ